MYKKIKQEMFEFVRSINKQIDESDYTYKEPDKLDEKFTQNYLEELFKSKWWETTEITDREKVKFFIWYGYLLCPFGEMHSLIEKVLERSVFTSEFAFIENIRNEFLGNRGKMPLSEHLNDLNTILNKPITLIDMIKEKKN